MNLLICQVQLGHETTHVTFWHLTCTLALDCNQDLGHARIPAARLNGKGTGRLAQQALLSRPDGHLNVQQARTSFTTGICMSHH